MLPGPSSQAAFVTDVTDVNLFPVFFPCEFSRKRKPEKGSQ
jgi:hypothetical protein